MKKITPYLLAFLFCLTISVTVSSCKTGEGCGLEEKYNKDVDLKSKKRGKSKLFK